MFANWFSRIAIFLAAKPWDPKVPRIDLEASTAITLAGPLVAASVAINAEVVRILKVMSPSSEWLSSG